MFAATICERFRYDKAFQLRIGIPRGEVAAAAGLPKTVNFRNYPFDFMPHIVSKSSMNPLIADARRPARNFLETHRADGRSRLRRGQSSWRPAPAE